MRRLFAVVLLLALAATARAEPAATPGPVAIRSVLALRLPENARTRLLPRDPVLAAVVAGTWQARRPGARVPLDGGAAAVWSPLAADSAGWFRHEALEGGWACATVDLPAAGVWLLEAANHEYVFVNGEPRAGNRYQAKDTFEAWEPRHDYSSLPVALRAGRNEFLFRCDRGGLKAVLRRPPTPVLLNARDLTAPDFVVGRAIEGWAALPVVNATGRTLTGLVLEVSSDAGVAGATPLPPVPPLTVRKVGFRLAGPARSAPGSLDLVLRLREGPGPDARTLAESAMTLRVVGRDAVRAVTFVSGIDGSVQYFAELPPPQGSVGWGEAGLVLSLHGANVEARNQAASYAPKPWARIVAPTNRRPYGYSWEDWGRLDALEVLDLALGGHEKDGDRVWLTGHSMGGHGAWLLGATCPDRFAAIGPSAGWATFWTYRFEYDRAALTPAEKLLTRGCNASDTFALLPNLATLGVYCLQGAADDNVPPRQSHLLVEQLRTFHPDWVYREEPGQGHWWDLSPAPGTDCVDWAPMFDFFARRVRLPGGARPEIDFRTASPGVSSRGGWVTVVAQEHAQEPSRVHVRCVPEQRLVRGETQNVAELALAPLPLGQGGDFGIELDGQSLPAEPGSAAMPGVPTAWLAKRDGRWVRQPRDAAPDPRRKNPRRGGPFKDAFRNRFLLVVGTRGSAQENAWAAAKARYDAETWWYQGNGAVDVVRDVDFDAQAEPDRGVILYGAAAANAAWAKLLPGCPVQVGRGSVQVGRTTVAGDDLACLFVRPRPGSDVACVAVVCGTGPAGRRLADTLPYLQAGFALPDCCVLSPRLLSGGEAGIRAAGFFGNDWSVENGEFLWHD